MTRLTLASLFAATLFAVSLAADTSVARPGSAGVAGPGGGGAAAAAAPGGESGAGESRTTRRIACIANCPTLTPKPRPRPVRARIRQVQPTPECAGGQRVEFDVVSFRFSECHAAPR